MPPVSSDSAAVSSLDVAKLAALLLGSGEDLDQAWGVGNARGPRLPLVLVPTTAGTGSEVTPVSIITVGDEESAASRPRSSCRTSRCSIPELTLGLPAGITAATGIDAMVHAIEAYASRSANNNPVSKTLAREALRLLSANIETAVFDGTNMEARSAMLLGSIARRPGLRQFAGSPPSTRSPTRSAAPFTCPTGCPTRWCCRMCCGSMRRMPGHLYAENRRRLLSPPIWTAEEGTQGRCNAFIDRLAALSAKSRVAAAPARRGIGDEHFFFFFSGKNGVRRDETAAATRSTIRARSPKPTRWPSTRQPGEPAPAFDARGLSRVSLR